MKTLDEILQNIGYLEDISHVKVDIMLYISKLTKLQEIQSCDVLYSLALKKSTNVEQFRQNLDNEIQKYNTIRKETN